MLVERFRWSSRSGRGRWECGSGRRGGEGRGGMAYGGVGVQHPSVSSSDAADLHQACLHLTLSCASSDHAEYSFGNPAASSAAQADRPHPALLDHHLVVSCALQTQ
mmetsp:Transcript_34059/g.40049  ORF Transcript_34059/g.40049 Transcript_34059/m.40049 type:complete len:106 (+) Transcript_34059:183-500(+)